MKDGRAIEVTILDRTLKIACREEEKAQLLLAVEYLDAKMREVKSASKVLSVERVAIMAALNIAHELLNAQQASGFDSEAFRRRMKTMADAIDEAMSAQEHLF
jgi:cell division protein ZapA